MQNVTKSGLTLPTALGLYERLADGVTLEIIVDIYNVYDWIDGAPMTTFSTDFRLPVALVIAIWKMILVRDSIM